MKRNVKWENEGDKVKERKLKTCEIEKRRKKERTSEKKGKKE
jgi:hypothetical protein